MVTTDWIIAISTLITSLIFIGIFILTFKYANSTREIANKTEHHIKVINDIEKAKLTYKLIEEWSYDKKLLTIKREKIGEHYLNIESSNFSVRKSIEFIEHFNNFLDYFTMVNELMENNRIEKKLYLKILSREVVNFYRNEYDANVKVISRIRDKFRKGGRGLPVTSDFDGLRKIYNYAEKEIGN